MRPSLLAVLAMSLLMACAGDVPTPDLDSEAQALHRRDRGPNYKRLYRKAFRHKYRVKTLTTNLPSGDEADVYFPRVRNCRRHADEFPLVPMLSGGLVEKGMYSMFAKRLASYGFVVVVTNHYQILGPPPPQGGPPPAQLFTALSVITDVLEGMQLADADPDSPLYRIVDTENMGLSGHSFGGGAALYAVEGTCRFPFCGPPPAPGPPGPDIPWPRPPQLKAAALYGTHTVPPPPAPPIVDDIDTSAVPTMIIQGEGDDLDLATATYELFEDPRALVEMAGYNHYGITNIQNPPTNTPDPYEQTVSQRRSTKRIAQWAALWFRAHLQGDPIATALVFDSGGVKEATVTSEM